MPSHRKFNGPYSGEFLNWTAFPMGGIGAGMICLDGTGKLSHFSVRNKPEVFNEPYAFAAICVQGATPVARVLEGPVPPVKAFGSAGSGNGSGDKTYGFPRFASAVFKARFPFGVVRLKDPLIPLQVEITGWSPFIPGDADSSSLPVAALEYRFKNASAQPVEAVFSFNSKNLMASEKEGHSVGATENGFILRQSATREKPWVRGDLCVVAEAGNKSAPDSARDVAVNCAWFRGGKFDPQTIAWQEVAEGKVVSRPPVTAAWPSPGASLYVPFRLDPGQEETVRLMLSWYVPESDLRFGEEPKPGEACGAGCGCATPSSSPGAGESAKPLTYSPWYAGAFPDVEAVAKHWRDNYGKLRRKSMKFSRCFYDTTLPPEIIEAVAANLSILKSPTCLRQKDGRFWAWEGCSDDRGCCHGACTHVWNYAQALPHLFPELERSLRQTEFNVSQDERGHQTFRTSLPIRPVAHRFHAAADGQLGGVMKVYREWRISGDAEWLRALWPKVKASLNYCIETWDPERNGFLREPHHNTYDIEFWGPDGMCSGFYLGALKAMTIIGLALGEDVQSWEDLFRKGVAFLESELFDGEYFYQKVEWRNLRAPDPTASESTAGNYSPEAVELFRNEGPESQYGRGCLSDGVLGAWLAAVCGLPEFMGREKVRSHLRAVHRYNFRKDLSAHANPQRPSYAFGREGGLLLCTWPKGRRLSLPFPYSDEVWTGIEYQVASHLMMHGLVEEGLEIVRACRVRHDGRVRNPFDEYECGHWYARAMSSYGLLQGITGARYDAVEKILHLSPAVSGDFRAFLCTATGYGTVGVKDGKPFVEVKEGAIAIGRIEYEERANG